MNPILWQRIEGFLVLAAATAIFMTLDAGLPWWLAIVLFFAPDLSFFAYLAGPRIGAFGYNFVHIYGFGAALLGLGLLVDLPLCAALGALWLGHSGFDRMLGYGLKLTSGFKHTHLGDLG